MRRHHGGGREARDGAHLVEAPRALHGGASRAARHGGLFPRTGTSRISAVSFRLRHQRERAYPGRVHHLEEPGDRSHHHCLQGAGELPRQVQLDGHRQRRRIQHLHPDAPRPRPVRGQGDDVRRPDCRQAAREERSRGQELHQGRACVLRRRLRSEGRRLADDPRALHHRCRQDSCGA